MNTGLIRHNRHIVVVNIFLFIQSLLLPASRDGKPYLIDAQVRRTGAGWADDPWVPDIRSSRV